MGTLDEILDEKTVVTKEVKEEAPKETVDETKQARDGTGKFAKQEVKDETQVSQGKENEEVKEVKKEVKQELTERERAFLAAAHDERIKRQALEKRLTESEKTVEAKSFWDDPEAALKKFQDEMQGVVTNTRLNTAETIARSKYKDFDDQIQAFAGLLQNTPGLYQQWLQSSDPAEYAYTTGKKHREISQIGGLDTWKSNTEKEIRLRLEQEYKDKVTNYEKEKSALPGSLSGSRGVAQTTPVFSGPTSLDDILKAK